MCGNGMWQTILGHPFRSLSGHVHTHAPLLARSSVQMHEHLNERQMIEHHPQTDRSFNLTYTTTEFVHRTAPFVLHHLTLQHNRWPSSLPTNRLLCRSARPALTHRGAKRFTESSGKVHFELSINSHQLHISISNGKLNEIHTANQSATTAGLKIFDVFITLSATHCNHFLCVFHLQGLHNIANLAGRIHSIWTAGGLIEWQCIYFGPFR